MENYDKQIEKNVCRLTCGTEQATAFRISTNLVITATHSLYDFINKNENIILEFYNITDKLIKVNTTPIDDIKTGYNFPIAILRIESLIDTDFLHFTKHEFQRCSNWETFGYPAAKPLAGAWLSGYISRVLDKYNPYDWNIDLNSDSKIEDYSGLSGAPLIVNKKVVGVVISQSKQNGKAISIGAVSITRFTDMLYKHKVNIFDEIEKFSPEYFKNVDDLGFKQQNDLYFETTRIEYNQATHNIDILDTGIKNPITYMNADSNYHKEQLGEIYEEQLEKLISQRINGDIDGAWKEMKKALEDFAVRDIQRKVIARYYYLAAQWALSDFQDSAEANRYYKHAVSIDIDLDTRAFRAKIFAQEGKYDDALKLLNPLDKENILNTALLVLFQYGKGGMAEEILSQASVKLTHATMHILALCNIQGRNFSMADLYIQKAITCFPKSPIYHLVAGVIDYWQAIPEDICDSGKIMPIFLKSNTFTLTEKQTEKLEEAIVHYNKAKEYASYHSSSSIVCEILQAWILTASLLPNKKPDADNLLKELLLLDPHNSVALLYAAENNIKVDPKLFSYLEQSVKSGNVNLNHVAALIQIYINMGSYFDALDILEKYKSEFKANMAQESWMFFILDVYIKTNNFENAEKLLEEFTEVDFCVRSRAKGLIYERQGKKDELIELAKKLATNPGTRLDIENLVFIYRKYDEWEDVITYANVWYDKYSDIRALELIAEATLMLHKPDKCLETIEKLSGLLPEGKLTEQAKLHKMDAFRMLSRIDDAIQLANNIWEERKNDKILLLRAKLFLINGDNNSAISILRDGISRGFTKTEIYIMLVELIKVQHPQEAFNYAKDVLQENPDNPDIYLWTTMLGFNTGNDYEASMLMFKFQEKFPDSNLLRTFSTTELVPMTQKWMEESNERWKSYADGQIPFHVILETENIAFGLDFYLKWNYNQETDYNLQKLLLFSFGGRQQINDISIFRFGSIFMDYSSCLVAHKLELFGFLNKAFQKIIVPSQLLKHILMEINEIRTIQPKIVENRKKILSSINKLRVKMIELPLVNNNEFHIETQDLHKYIAAKNQNAFIVEDSFATEMLYGKHVPEQIKALQVYTKEVLFALVEMGFVSNDDLGGHIHSKEIRRNIIEKLINEKPPLLVDLVFLETMQEIECIDTVMDVFDLLVFDNVFEPIKDEQQAFEKRNNAAIWLEKLNERLIELRNEGYLFLSPVIENDKTVNGNGYLNMIGEMLEYGNNNDIPLWCDDRNINSYSRVGKSPIVGIFDVLEFLRESNFISQEVYRAKVGSLFKLGVKFQVPPIEYLKMCLNMAGTGTAASLICETSRLRDIRHSIISALSEETVIGKHKLAHVHFPEVGGYIINLRKMFEDAMYYVWTIEGKDEKWRQATAAWLLLNCSDFASETTHLIGNTEQIESLIASKHAILICIGFRMILTFDYKNANVSADYLNWLFSWLERYWVYNPNVRKESIESVAQFIYGVAYQEPGYKITKHARRSFLYFFNKFIRNLPEDFKDDFMEHQNIKELVVDEYKEIIIIEGFFANIPKDIWILWVNNAVSRGTELKGTEHFYETNINISFVNGSIFEQNVILEWKDKNDKHKRISISMPYAQLYSNDGNIRASWLDLAQNHIYMPRDIEYYREALKNQEKYKTIVDELIDLVEKSLGFYFHKLGLQLKIDSEKLPNEKKLFPHNPQIFINELSQIPLLGDTDGERWLEYCLNYIKGYGINNLLIMLSSLPLGGSWAFCKIMCKFVEQNFIEQKFLMEWCIDNLKFTHNPIRQQNLLEYILIYKDLLIDEHIDLIKNTIINLLEEFDTNSDISHCHNFFITLLKTAWHYMESISGYNLINQEQKILWSYIYADRVLALCVDLIESKSLPYNMKVFADTFDEVVQNFDRNTRLLNNKFKIIPEVSHPVTASVWRIVFGRTIAIIEQNTDNLMMLKEYLLPIISKVLKSIPNIKGVEELLLGFEEVDNYFKTNFNKNVYIRIKNITDSWKVENSEEFDRIDFFRNALRKLVDGEELNEVHLLHFMVLAKQPFPEELAPMIKEVLQKYNLSLELTDEFKVRGRMIFASTNGFKQKDKEYIRGLYKNRLRDIFMQNPERWEIFIELLGTFCSSEDYVKASEAIVSCLEETLLAQQYIEIKPGFGEFITSMAWWLPAQFTERIHKLRRSIIW